MAGWKVELMAGLVGGSMVGQVNGRLGMMLR